MVEEERLQKKYSDSSALKRINQKNKLRKGCNRSVELFFSFDIVNSSSYKDINYFGWQIVLTSLLTNIQGYVAKEIPEAQLWRILGDEIIFFVTIKNMEEIYTSIDTIYSVLVKSNIKLHNGSFFDELTDDCTEKDINLMKASNIIAVQAASWIAIILNGEKQNICEYDNVFEKYNINESQQINEFLGQDIKKETQDRRLVVSIELAKILSEKTKYLSRLNIITYKNLKGVWKNRLYPIIWYHDVKISGGVTFEDSFYYDETTYSQLSKEYFLNREEEKGNLTSYMFLDVGKALNKIIKDQNLENKIKKIYDVVDETENDIKTVENEFDAKLLEFHCVAVCCDVDKKKVLIAKRKNNRKWNPALWEFGCAKADTEKSLIDAVCKDYEKDFGINIEIVCDEEREDKQPKPIALYQIDKAEKLQKGVIMVAKVIGSIESVEKTIKVNGKHEECRWISQEEVDKFNEPAVKDFKNTLNKVFSNWEDYFKEM